MKYQRTNIKTDDIKDSIEKVVENLKKEEPIKLYSNILNANREIASKEITDGLTDFKFEQ